jgi:uncharacterized membrane protein
MVKKKLSSNLIAEKIVLILVLIITILFWISIPEIPVIVFLLVLVFIAYSVYAIYFVVSNLSYDDSFLYIKDRKQEKVVELKKIVQIKLTPYYGS